MPVLTATGAGVRHRRRWLFRDLDVTVEPGDLVAVVGPPGSGRTTVLLALARRFRLTTGTVEPPGVAALGHVPGVTGPELVLTVAEHIRERFDLLGLPVKDVPLYGLDPAARGWELSPYERQLLGLVLARLEDPRVIALDDVDEGLDAAERDQLRQILRDLTATGVAVVVTTREAPADENATVIRLGTHPAPSPSPEPSPSPSPDPVAEPESEDAMNTVDDEPGEVAR